MSKRLTRERIEQIRAEVKAFNRGDCQCDPGADSGRCEWGVPINSE